MNEAAFWVLYAAVAILGLICAVQAWMLHELYMHVMVLTKKIMR